MKLEEQLQRAIRKGDEKGCLALLEAAPEKERAALSATMLKTFDLAHALIFSRDPSRSEKKLEIDLSAHGPDDRVIRNKVLEAARVALLGTLTSVEALKKYAWRSAPKDDDVAVAVLAIRPPAFVHAWATKLCELTHTRFTLARRLVKEGLCERPDGDGYVLAMIYEASHRGSGWSKKKEELFEEDPELLDDDVWRVFEVEGNRDVSLTGNERKWSTLLLGWVETKRLDRGRMLDATLSALARDFPQHKAGFYSRLHDAMKPTPEETAKRAAAYVELLGSRISPTVSLATRVVESLPDDVELDLASFVPAAVSAARSARGQGTALALLRLLGARRERPEALDAVVSFLEHGAPEVVDAALGILEASKPSKALRARVASLVATVPASRRARLAAWAGTKPEQATKAAAKPDAKVDAAPADAKRAGIAELAKADPTGPWPRVLLDDRANPAPRLDPERRVAPIASHEELIAAASRALEEPNDRVTFERMLDGIARLGVPLSDFPRDRIKPLAKRAARLAGKHFGARIVDAWLLGEDGSAIETEKANVQDFGERRGKNLLARLARGETGPLLSMPTTETFFIDPRVLAERVKDAAKRPRVDVEDAVIAILRLAPEHRRAASKKLEGVKGPVAAAVRHALGSDEDEPNPKFPALWFAAARARGGDDAAVMKAFPDAGAGAGEAARVKLAYANKENTWAWLDLQFEPPPPKKLLPDALTVLLATRAHAGEGALLGMEPTLREVASFTPGDRRVLLAHGTEAISGNVDWNSAEWSNHVYIELLLDPDLPLDEDTLFLLAIATNTKEARENALATDALIAAIADGRVVGPELGPKMAFFWDPIHESVKWSRRPTASRWAKTLATVAQTSPLHAEVVRRILESFFGAPPAAPPPDVNVLLQLWLDLAVEARVAVPDPEVLTKYTGKAKKIANQLVALRGGPSVLAAEAHALALEGRKARAARWTKITSSG